MSAFTEWGLHDRSATFSFYLTAHHCTSRPQDARAAASLADKLTIAGPKGPTAADRLRASGFNSPILFDGTGYARQDLPPPDVWVDRQRRAEAACHLLPGFFLPWNKDSSDGFLAAVQEQSRIAADLDATILLAIDARWIARRTDLVVDTLCETGQAVALVLADPADPLSVGGAVPGLRRIASRVSRLSVLRSDHGAIGALAFGADHASVGLRTGTRHFAEAGKGARRNPGPSSRVFVRSLLDWFLADQIAGWTAAGRDLECDLECCDGRSLGRFIDPDLDVNSHNMKALAEVAEYVLNADPVERARLFLDVCRDAASKYGVAGFKGPENPKPQLTSWVLS